MALVLNDRVKETSTTTGTGTLDLAGAVQDFEGFVAGIGTGNTTYYSIVNTGTGEFEVGIGTVTDATPDTLSRDTILSSSNSDAAVNFSAGTKDVFCTLPASKAVVEDANNDVSLPADLTVGANIDVSSGTIKLDGSHPEGSNNTALGGDAGAGLTTGSGSNTLLGSRAGTSITTAVNNVAIGRNSLDANVTSGNNVAVGSSAGGSATGADNTFLGGAAGSSVTSGSNLTVIGRSAQASSATATNEITLGNASVTSLRIPGLASGASSGDVLTYDGTDITLSTPTTGASEAFAIKMAVGL